VLGGPDLTDQAVAAQTEADTHVGELIALPPRDR
jgi:hypothetical protein